MIKLKNINSSNLREYALFLMFRVLHNDFSTDNEMALFRKTVHLPDERNYYFIFRLAEGTVKSLILLDGIIKALLKKEPETLPENILNILRLAIYELTFMNSPNHAVTNEWVELARKYGHSGTVKLTNGILRNYLRKKTQIFSEFDNLEPAKRISIKYAMPEWIIKYWTENKELAEIEKICAELFSEPPVYLRINTLQTEPENLKKKFVEDGISFKETFIEELIELQENNISLTEIHGYKEGYWYVQDLGSAAVAKILNPQPDSLIIDFCAFPGGKTSHISALMKNTGKVLAIDINEKRKKIFHENISRLGCTNIEVRIQSAADNPNIENLADKILVDPPCSGLGVIRRKPEIKYRRSLDDIKRLADLQMEILENASNFLKPGGELVYSTCTFSSLENEAVIEKFLKKNKNFRLKPIKLLKEKRGYINLYPHIYNSDIFFIALLEKTI